MAAWAKIPVMAANSPSPLAQACAVAYCEVAGGVEFCLVTSIKKGRWGFPKGIVDPGETPQQAALKEASEEAGLSGRILGAELGSYDDFKWGRDLIVTGFLMQVTGVADTWLESGMRRRAFLTADETAARIAHHGQRQFLAVALERLRSRS